MHKGLFSKNLWKKIQFAITTNVVIAVVYLLSRVQFFVTPRTIAHQAPLSMELSRQEYWRGCHFLLQGNSQPRD